MAKDNNTGFCEFRGQQRKQMSGFLTKLEYRELLDTVKARKPAYYSHAKRKEIMKGKMPDARRRGRPCMAWVDNINTWTGVPVEELIRMTEDRDK